MALFGPKSVDEQITTYLEKLYTTETSIATTQGSIAQCDAEEQGTRDKLNKAVQDYIKYVNEHGGVITADVIDQLTQLNNDAVTYLPEGLPGEPERYKKERKTLLTKIAQAKQKVR